MYTLPDLPYSYSALEPFIDEATMRLHHDKHHAAYVDNFNKAVAAYPKIASRTPEDLLAHLADVPEPIRVQVRNQGGGAANHSFFWQIMASPNSAGQPDEMLAAALSSQFKSTEEFISLFSETAAKHFGSGWVWLVADTTSQLSILATANQDSPLSQGLDPLLGIDVWEHAYYLKYQNRRAEYISAWWNVVNWKKVSQLLASV